MPELRLFFPTVGYTCISFDTHIFWPLPDFFSWCIGQLLCFSEKYQWKPGQGSPCQNRSSECKYHRHRNLQSNQSALGRPFNLNFHPAGFGNHLFRRKNPDTACDEYLLIYHSILFVIIIRNSNIYKHGAEFLPDLCCRQLYHSCFVPDPGSCDKTFRPVTGHFYSNFSVIQVYTATKAKNRLKPDRGFVVLPVNHPAPYAALQIFQCRPIQCNLRRSWITDPDGDLDLYILCAFLFLCWIHPCFRQDRHPVAWTTLYIQIKPGYKREKNREIPVQPPKTPFWKICKTLSARRYSFPWKWWKYWYIFYLSGEYRYSPQIQRKWKKIATLKEGEVFGEMSYLLNENRSATAVAETESMLIVITPAIFEELLQANNTFSRNLIQLLSNRLRNTHFPKTPW